MANNFARVCCLIITSNYAISPPPQQRQVASSHRISVDLHILRKVRIVARIPRGNSTKCSKNAFLQPFIAHYPQPSSFHFAVTFQSHGTTWILWLFVKSMSFVNYFDIFVVIIYYFSVCFCCFFIRLGLFLALHKYRIPSPAPSVASVKDTFFLFNCTFTINILNQDDPVQSIYMRGTLGGIINVMV